MNRFLLTLLIAALPLLSAQAQSQQSRRLADRDWEAVTALDAGPPRPATPPSQEEAGKAALAFLQQQEAALRHFVNTHPRDARGIEARLRLAHILASYGELTGQRVYFDQGRTVLDGAARIAPASRQADVEFTKITLRMREIGTPTEADRATLSQALEAFRARYPEDRRLAMLITEIATLYDDQPAQKERLLRVALSLAQQPGLQARINDDLRRLGMLGKPVSLQGTTTSGTALDLGAFKGQVVVLYFFAGWSVPSLAGLQQLAELEKQLPQGQVAIIGISLDRDKAALEKVMEPIGRDWPILLETQGWESPRLRALGLNALPTLWLVDKKGNLRVLNGSIQTEARLRALLAEP